jgi:uncharacterized integral membrane protein
MRIRVLPVLLLLVLSGLFALINWTAFTTPTTLNLGFMMVSAPLGAVMLGIVALLAVMYIASVVYLYSVALTETRRLNRDLAAQRELVDKAEASRFTELRDFMAAELQRVTQAADDTRTVLLARVEQMEQRSRAMMEETGNSLSAYIGQLEDRLDRERVMAQDLPPPRGDGYPRAPR